jgi:hypothetical protein
MAMTVPHPPATSPVTSDAADSSGDPLSKLHHMSTTAGVASQKYVAVNTAAIIGALLGLASGLAIFSPLLLVIPAAGVIVSIFAWHRIHNSSGTEKGTPMAVLGLVLSLAIGGGIIAHIVQDERKVQHDVDQMSVILDHLVDDVKASKYDQAYQLFDSQFQSRISSDSLRGKWLSYQHPQAYGPLQSLKWNHVPPFSETVHGGDERLAKIQALAKFEKGELRLSFLFRNPGDGWHLEDITEFFGTPQ